MTDQINAAMRSEPTEAEVREAFDSGKCGNMAGIQRDAALQGFQACNLWRNERGK